MKAQNSNIILLHHRHRKGRVMPDNKPLYAAIAEYIQLQDEWLVLKRKLWMLERKTPDAGDNIATLEEQIADARKRVDSGKYMIKIELDKLMDAYRYWLRRKVG